MTKVANGKSFTFISLFPELIRGYLQDGLLSKAIHNNLIQVEIINLRDFSDNKYKSVDDRAYGGGDGMVVRADILEKSLQSVPDYKLKKVIYLSPQGKTWSSQQAKKWALNSESYILISGRYAGVDQRFISQYVDEEISIGDYVLSGGELAGLVLLESTSRFIPGVLGDESSAQLDSFENQRLEAAQFTKPASWNGLDIPSVLLSGHHLKIREWCEKVSLLITFKKRQDLLDISQLNLEELASFYQKLSPEEVATLGLEDLRFPYG